MSNSRRTFLQTGMVASAAMLTATNAYADEPQVGPWQDQISGAVAP